MMSLRVVPVSLGDWRNADYLVWAGNELQVRRAARVLAQLIDGRSDGKSTLWIVRRIATETPYKSEFLRTIIQSYFPHASIVEAVEPYVFFDLGLMEQTFYRRVFERWLRGLKKPKAILIPAARNKFAQIAEAFQSVHRAEVYLVEDGLGNIREIQSYLAESQAPSRTLRARNFFGRAWELMKQWSKGLCERGVDRTRIKGFSSLVYMGFSSLVARRGRSGTAPLVFREFSRAYVRSPQDWVPLLPRSRVFQLDGFLGAEQAVDFFKQEVGGALVDVEAVFLLPAGDFPKEMWETLVARALEAYEGKIFFKPHPNHQSYAGFFAALEDHRFHHFTQLHFAEEFETFTQKYKLECLIGLTSTAMTYHRARAPQTRIESISDALVTFVEHPNSNFRKLAKQELAQNKMWATGQTPPPSFS